MRTVLNGIKSLDSIFILNGDGGEENRIAERQREREKVCERQCVRRRRESAGHKMSCYKNTCGKMMWD
jgi:hypothetical protein